MRILTLLFALLLVCSLTSAVALQSSNDDDRIYDQVRRRLANDPDIKGATFEVEVENGVVTVKGAVEKEKFRDKAERLVKRVKGVKKVVNNITLKN